jgi:hypothetical protein
VALNTIILTPLLYIVESGVKHHNTIVINGVRVIVFMPLSTIYHNRVRVIVFNATFNNIYQWG